MGSQGKSHEKARTASPTGTTSPEGTRTSLFGASFGEAARRGRWIWLFSGGVGLAMLLTAVPLFLAPLRAGLANNLFPQHYVTFSYFVAYALTMLAYQGGVRRKHIPALFAFGPAQALIGTAGCALLVAGRLALNAAYDAWVAAGKPTELPTGPDWVDPIRCVGAALSAFAAACALMSAYRLLRRLEPGRATIACVGAFSVLAALTVGFTYATGLVSLVLYALAPLGALALLHAADASVPYADLAGTSPVGREPSAPREVQPTPGPARDVARYCALFGVLFLLGLWVLEFTGSHKAGDNGYLMVPVFAPLALGLFAIGCWLMLRRKHAMSYALLCRVALPALGLCTLLMYLPRGTGPIFYLETLAAALALAALLLADTTVWCVDLTHMSGAGLASERLFVLQRVVLCGALLATDVVYSFNFELYVKLKIAIGLLLIALTVVTLCYARPQDPTQWGAGAHANGVSAQIHACVGGNGAQAHTCSGSSDAESHGLAGRAGEEAGPSVDVQAREIEAHGLTAREAEVFTLLMSNLDAKSIADQLGISRTTVNTHIQHVYTKFGVHSYKELARVVRG